MFDFKKDDTMKIGLFLIAAFLIMRMLFQQPETPAPAAYNSRQYMAPKARGKREGFAPYGDSQVTLPPPKGTAPVSPGPEDKILMGDKCMEPGQFLSSNLLPKADPNAKGWADFAPNPALQGQSLFLEPEKVIGIDTISNHLRNASRDIRKEPPNPTVPVSPWINTTIGPDLVRKPLEDCDMLTAMK
jgi:hypothetical protein